MTIMTKTDAFVLMQLRDAVTPIKSLPKPEFVSKMLIIGKPFYDKLKANGHDHTTALELMKTVIFAI
jgi:hypothetical protein